MKKTLSYFLCMILIFTGAIQVQAEETETSEQAEETTEIIDSDESEDNGASDSSELMDEEITEEETVEEASEEVTEEESADSETEESPAETDEENDAEPEQAEPVEEEEEKDISFTYSVHVQNKGWMSAADQGTQAGAAGKGLRMEAIKITPSKDLKALGDIVSQAHVQNKGWMSSVASGKTVGTTGASLRMEAVRFWLTGELAEQYDIYYRVYVQNNGWLGWAKNGAEAGSTGISLRIEAIEMNLVKKGMLMNASTLSSTVTGNGLKYQAYIQNTGWMKQVSSPSTAGTTGRSLRMEAIKISLPEELLASGNISVEAHVQNKGWLGAKKSGENAGTTGQGLRLEALKIKLTGDLANQYDIWYRVHVANTGWLGWTKNGGVAGSVGMSRAIEAVDIDLVPKGMTSHTASTAYIKQSEAKGAAIVSTARSWVGRGVYAYGGEDPHTGTDCAGFVRYVFRQNGIELNRSSWEMVNNGHQIDASQVRAGDLAIWTNHVAIMTGSGSVVHALNPSLGIRESAWGSFIASGNFLGFYRINGVN